MPASIFAAARSLMQHSRGVLRGPFNIDACRAAGFNDDELVMLQVFAQR